MIPNLAWIGFKVRDEKKEVLNDRERRLIPVMERCSKFFESWPRDLLDVMTGALYLITTSLVTTDGSYSSIVTGPSMIQSTQSRGESSRRTSGNSQTTRLRNTGKMFAAQIRKGSLQTSQLSGRFLGLEMTLAEHKSLPMNEVSAFQREVLDDVFLRRLHLEYVEHERDEGQRFRRMGQPQRALQGHSP